MVNLGVSGLVLAGASGRLRHKHSIASDGATEATVLTIANEKSIRLG
jgi:hypothetical protein